MLFQLCPQGTLARDVSWIGKATPVSAPRVSTGMTVNVVIYFQNALGNGCRLLFRYCRLGIFALGMFSLTFRLEGATPLPSQDVISGIDKAQQKRERRLAGYAAVEHYTVRNSHFEETAELEAKVLYQRGLGKRYQVLWRKGPGFLQDRVINRILKGDAVLSRSPERSRTLLTSANYSMKVLGTQLLQGEQCYIVNIRPRVHKFPLIEGTAWVDAKDFSLLRIEGRPATSPSFWTGRPFIEREYTVLDGLSLPKHSRATSKGFFAGKSELDIDYSPYVITRSPVQNKTPTTAMPKYR